MLLYRSIVINRFLNQSIDVLFKVLNIPCKDSKENMVKVNSEITKSLSLVKDISSYYENDWITKVYMPFFLSNQHLITDYWYACSNPNLLHYLLSSKDLKLNWNKLSSNLGLTIDIITKYPDKRCEWYWGFVAANPSIRMQDIMDYPEYPWKWHYGVSSNPNLTMDFINQNPTKFWNFNLISFNI